MALLVLSGFFSVFAYIWLLIILMVSSPDVVEPWEAVLTFLFFPLLTGLAFAADKGWLDKCASRVAQQEGHRCGGRRV